MSAQIKLPNGLRIDSNDAIVITSGGHADRRILHINPAFMRLTGFEPQELLGRNGDLLLADGPLRMDSLLWLDSESDGREVHWIARFHRRDGTLFCAEAQVHRVPLPQGGENLVMVVEDVTERLGRRSTGQTGKFNTRKIA